MKKLLIVIGLVFLCFSGYAIAASQNEEYIVAPGDILYIAVWADPTLTGPVPVSPDGTIGLPTPIGVVKVAGMTTKQIAENLTANLAKYVKNPQLTVSLREEAEKGFLVHITGEVINPRFYRVPEGTSLQELISYAGGPTKYADTKHIKVGAQVIDFSKFLKENDQSANPTLKVDDVVFIPRISNKEYMSNIVNILGAVKKAGVFEFEEPMALLDALALADGLTSDANMEEVQIVNLDPANYSIQTVNIKGYLTKSDSAANPMVYPRSVVFVPSSLVPVELTIPVNIGGQIKNPGRYRMVVQKSHLADLIFTAGGFTEIANPIVKIIHQDRKAEEQFNVKEFLSNGDETQNPLLREGDTVVVTASDRTKQISSAVDTFLLPFKTVKTLGALRSPGTFQVSKDATLLDILNFAGGVSPTADLKKAVVIRENGGNLLIDLKRVLSEGRFELLPEVVSGDTIFIPEQQEGIWPKIVRLSGQLSTISLLGIYMISLIGK